jgi:hypothetical protein
MIIRASNDRFRIPEWRQSVAEPDTDSNCSRSSLLVSLKLNYRLPIRRSHCFLIGKSQRWSYHLEKCPAFKLNGKGETCWEVNDGLADFLRVL